MNDKEYIYCPLCKSTLKDKKIEKNPFKVYENCGFVDWKNPKPVVSLLIHKNGKVLMIQRANEPFKGQWVLPGGFISKNESPEEAILRETEEETGLKPKIEGFLGFYGKYFDPRGDHIDIIFFGIADGTLKLSDEDKKAEYFSPDKLPEKIAYRHKEAISDWAAKNL